MNIGKRIKDLRISKNISQVDLAQIIGVSKQTLYKYENNIITNIPSDKIENLAKALGTTPAFIMGWDTFKVNNVGKAIKEISGNQPVAIGALVCNTGIPEEEINNILEEKYESISKDCLIKIADYFNTSISFLLKYNTYRLSSELHELMDKHDMKLLDTEAALANYLYQIGYDVYFNANSDDKDLTITKIATNESVEVTNHSFNFLRSMFRHSIDTYFESVLNNEL